MSEGIRLPDALAEQGAALTPCEQSVGGMILILVGHLNNQTMRGISPHTVHALVTRINKNDSLINLCKFGV